MPPVACLSVAMEPCISSGSGASGGLLESDVAQQPDQSPPHVLWRACLCFHMTMSGAAGQCFVCWRLCLLQGAGLVQPS